MMKTLHLVTKKNTNGTTFSLLKKSAEARGIAVVTIDTKEFDPDTRLKFTGDDLLYRITTDSRSCLVEKILINRDVTSFHSSYANCIGKLDNVLESTLMHQKNGLPIIPTILALPKNITQAQKHVKTLGGFPVVLKALGGMHGNGVVKIDSMDALATTLFSERNNPEGMIMRKFVRHREQARLIVLGDKVIASHANIAGKDFRTNFGDNSERIREVKTYDEKIRKIAVSAVKVLGLEFGGVDILFEEDTGKAYIAEVNFPCFFARTQQLTGIDIAGAMLDFLVRKS